MERRTILKGMGALAGAGVLGMSTQGPSWPSSGPNREALRRILEAEPVLVDVMPLSRFRPELRGKVLTHCGPPVDWQHMNGPVRGASIAAVLFEGWAHTPEAAKRLLSSGRVRFETNHDHQGAGGMAGVGSPSMLVYVVENGRHRAYSFNEFLSHYGAFDAAAVAQLHTWNDRYLPVLRRAIRKLGGLKLKPLTARGLLMGDDGHCRQDGATAAALELLAPAVIETSNDAQGAAAMREWSLFPHLLYLGFQMAAGKAVMLGAEAIPGASVVTVMARNGTETGIRVGNDRWHVAPAAPIDGHLLPGIDPGDVALDMGDSAICETWGVGGNAAAAAPALAHELGLQVADMLPISQGLRDLAVGTHTDLPIPALGGGPAAAFEVRRIVARRRTPTIFTAIALKEPGGGDRFAGLGHSPIPLACFEQAAAVLDG
jgi:hypothetical protein